MPSADIREEISRLSKVATQQKYEDLGLAIATLRQVKVLMASSPGYPVKQWLRLPKFLCEAGRFTEAMAELEELRQTTPVARDYSAARKNGLHMSISKEGLKMLMHADLVEIYEEMSTAAAWSGNDELSNEYESKAVYHAAKWEKLNEIHN